MDRPVLPPGARRCAAALAAALATCAAACSAPAPPAELARAEHLERQGRTDAALGAYDAALATCHRQRTPARRGRWCAEAHLGRAAALERLGRTAEAAAAFAALPAEVPAAPPAARASALSSAGRLYLEAGDARRAWTLLWQAITDYPDSAGADQALRALLLDGRGRDPRRLGQVLGQLYDRLAGTDIADNLLYAQAELARDELRQPEAARSLLDRLVAEQPDSPLLDDALWFGAALCQELGDHRGALARLRRLLATRERSYVVGSYSSQWLDDAQLAAARLLRDRLGDPRGAVGELERLPRHYPESVLRDDALYELAVTWGRLDDRERACGALARLRAGFPDSKHLLEAAPALASSLGCPTPAAAGERP